MKLATEISVELWDSVRASYEAGTYTHAILDACQHMTDVLRDRASVDADGVALVGQALEGENPRLRLNSLQTTSEQDEQKGFAHLVRGVYVAIRNPRSHESFKDDKQTADAIIVFLNYILAMIGRTEQTWSIDRFMARVLDQDFVPDATYANLLVNEIPSNKRLEAAIAVFRDRSLGDSSNLSWVTHALFKRLENEEIDELMSFVSREYEDVGLDSETVRDLFKLLEPKFWPRLGTVAKLRVEHKILGSLAEGQYNHYRTSQGALATWARDYMTQFVTSEEIRKQLTLKLAKDAGYERWYVASHFMRKLIELTTTPYQRGQVINALSNAILERGDPFIKSTLLEHYWPPEWKTALCEALSSLEETDPTYFEALKSLDEEEIPF